MNKIIIVLMILLTGCEDIEPKKGDFGYEHEKLKVTYYSKTMSTTIIEVDRHEYIVFSGYKIGGIVHKQNCKYCEKGKNE